MNFTERLRRLETLLTIAQAAELLCVTEKTARNWVARGRLPAKNIGSAKAPDWRVDPAELAAWYEARPVNAEVYVSAVARDEIGVADENDDGTFTLCEQHPAFPDVIFNDRGEECEV